MKLKQIFISLVLFAALLYLGLTDVSGNISSDIGNKFRSANTASRNIEQMEYKKIDGVCYLIIYESDGGIIIVPAEKEFCD
jgi:hypothetical protein